MLQTGPAQIALPWFLWATFLCNLWGLSPPQEPGWVVPVNKGISLLSQHPFRNSRNKQRTADRGVGEGGQEAAVEEPLC